MKNTLDRRSFLKGLAVSTVGVAGVAALSGCSDTETPATDTSTIASDEDWDGLYDVIVVGFGGAGAVAAKTAAEGGATVLLIDKAPEGHEGGNTRYCSQLFVDGHGDIAKTKSYMESLNGRFVVPDEIVQVFAEGVANISDNWVNSYGIKKEDITAAAPDNKVAFGYIYSPEYPEFEGSDTITLSALHDGGNDSYLWQLERQGVVDLKETIDVWFESPAVSLIQDEETKTIIGVEIDRKGTRVKIRANSGVVLSCGGFENNPEMVKDFLGMASYAPLGTLYNTGDGIHLATDVGADLWHMHAYECLVLFAGLGLMVPQGERTHQLLSFYDGSTFLVGTDGYRYLNEAEIPRHGHIYQNGEWTNMHHPERCFMIFDQAQMDATAASGVVPSDYLSKAVSAPTLTELASLIGTKEGVLEQTYADYSAAISMGHDAAFNRPVATMKPFGEGDVYALEVLPTMLNTQGGPRRNVDAAIVDITGNPIPHLYSAGEFGGLCSNMYQGGLNMAECLIFGQIAGRNAAVPKDDFPIFAPETTPSNFYTLGVETDLNDEEFETGNDQYIGIGSGIGGDLVVRITMDGSSIGNIEVLKQNETPDIGGKALEVLPQSVLEAQSTDIDTISGATVTSAAFFDAVDEALSQAK